MSVTGKGRVWFPLDDQTATSDQSPGTWRIEMTTNRLSGHHKNQHAAKMAQLRTASSASYQASQVQARHEHGRGVREQGQPAPVPASPALSHEFSRCWSLL